MFGVRVHLEPLFEFGGLGSSRSHSCPPSATITPDFARATGFVGKLVFDKDAMALNLNMVMAGRLVFSQHVLLALAQAGVTREGSYVVCPTIAFTRPIVVVALCLSARRFNASNNGTCR